MAQAVVLAAGMSSRAKTNKLALTLGKKSILAILVTTLQQHCSEIIVVTGHYKSEVEDLLGTFSNVKFVHNEAYERGMFSSVLKGVGEVTEDFLLIPGDCPLIDDTTVLALLLAEGSVRVPVSSGRRGHPLFIGKELIEALRQEPITSNLKLFRDRYPLTEVEVMDSGVLKDIDTIEAYNRVKKAWKGV